MSKSKGTSQFLIDIFLKSYFFLSPQISVAMKYIKQANLDVDF